MIRVGAGKHTEPFSEAALTPDFHVVLESLLSNMERVLALLHLPQEVFMLSQRLEKLAQASARDVAGGPDVPLHLHEAFVQNYEKRRATNALWTPQPGVDYCIAPCCTVGDVDGVRVPGNGPLATCCGSPTENARHECGLPTDNSTAKFWGRQTR